MTARQLSRTGRVQSPASARWDAHPDVSPACRIGGVGLVAALMMVCAAAVARADASFPAHSIEVVTQYPPGGIADTSFRAIQPFLSKELGVPLVVLNKAGAGGIIATEYVKHSAPDGYTILNGANTPFTTARAVNNQITYSISDFAALGFYAIDPTVVISGKGVPWKTFDQFVSYAKSHPGKLNYGDGGLGGGGFFTMEIIKRAKGLRIEAIHYKGSGALKTEILGGHIQLASGGRGALASLVSSGYALGLATTANARLPEIPDVPTLKELGIPDAAISPSMALFVVKGTPDGVVKKLSVALAKVMTNPKALAALRRSGMIPEYHDGPTTAQMYEAEYQRVRKIAQSLNLVH